MSKLRIGIFFGGSSREREVSFAGGRTVYDNLDKSLFQAIPIFVDSFGNFIKVDWQYVYKGSIRDFYPPASFLPDLPHGFQVYAESLNPSETEQRRMAECLGEVLSAEQLKEHIDFAFLALHGVFGEDGSIQGLLDWYGIPYSGSGVFASALGMNKARQKDLQERAGMYVNQYQLLKRDTWLNAGEDYRRQLFKFYNIEFSETFVIKPANQGSSLGVSILRHPDFEDFQAAMDLAFFRYSVSAEDWNAKGGEEKIAFVRQFTDIRSGLGLPLLLNGEPVFMPDALLLKLDTLLANEESVALEALENETEVVVEEFISGREFSCIVIRDDLGNPLALPPTEIKKKTDLFDYRSKYLPGLSQKETPIHAAPEEIAEIRDACVHLFEYFCFNVYARIDGFLSDSGEVFLNDPNTTSGMMPSSFFFHQAAEIGLNPSQFLTFIIRRSVVERMETGTRQQQTGFLLARLDDNIRSKQSEIRQRRHIAVIMGGTSFERHISMESGRNVYEKLSSSELFEPIPLFLTGTGNNIELYRLPIGIMLKDNADDIREKVMNFNHNPVIDDIVEEAANIIATYSPEGAVFEPQKVPLQQLSEICEGVFIALHGRPGEDGTIQKELKKLGLYYNGSEASSAEITINKYVTNQILREKGFLVAEHELVRKTAWINDKSGTAQRVAERFGFPLIAKPADDGCSAAVRKIKTVDELGDFMEAIFRETEYPEEALRNRLGLASNEEFPQKQELLIEKFISRGDAAKFLEVTGGMLTHRKEDGTVEYEVFEPSESLAETEILSLEEKFLAGEGQNLTPSRFSNDPNEQKRISTEVRETLKQVAQALNVTGYCRIDAFVRIYADGKVETVIIEVNSLPGMTPATCIYHQAALNGYRPLEFIKEILHFGEQSRTQHE